MTRSSRLAVIIPAHDAERTLASCLEHLVPQLHSDDELVVVDDGSTDATSAIARDCGADVVSGPRCGAGAARNRGAAATSAPWLLFVDSDVYVPAGLIDAIRSTVMDLSAQDALVTVYEPRPMHSNPGSTYLHLGQAHRMHSLTPGPGSVFGTSCAAVRRRAFEERGGFMTEQRFAGSEDRVFGESLGAGRVMLRTDLLVRHDKRVRVTDVLRLDARRAYSEARWRIRRRRMGAIMGRDSKGYLGLGYLARLASAPLMLLTPLTPVAAVPHLLAAAPLVRFAHRHAGLPAAAAVIGIGWVDSMVVLGAGMTGAVAGCFAPAESA